MITILLTIRIKFVSCFHYKLAYAYALYATATLLSF